MQPAEQGWDFPADEATLESWSSLLADQGADLLLFTLFAALVLVSFFRKSPRLKSISLVASVVYLGVFKSQLLSIVNVFGLVTFNLPVFRYNLAWYLFAAFAVASTVLWGRIYCGRVCAFGALTQLMDRIVPARWRWNMPKALERRAAYVKYAILAAVLGYFVATHDSSVYRYVEPFWMFGGQATASMWIALGVLLTATLFIRNLYCRFLCPLGAALGLLSALTVFRIKRWRECNTCRICEKACEWGAIQGPTIIKRECVRCDDCERLYADTTKCPHHIIVLRRSGTSVQVPGTRVPGTRVPGAS
jgi:polyferredoxin